jgi:hypothetical protein
MSNDPSIAGTGRPAGAGIATCCAVAACALLLGCEERLTPPPQPAQPQQGVLQGGSSTAGRAVDNARDLQNQVDLHNKKIEEAAEAVNKP